MFLISSLIVFKNYETKLETNKMKSFAIWQKAISHLKYVLKQKLPSCYQLGSFRKSDS